MWSATRSSHMRRFASTRSSTGCESVEMSGPWLGDSCSLVDAFRRKELSPLEALDDCLAAIDASDLNAFSFVAPDEARAAAKDADVSLPFGGVPLGVKELTAVQGWPDTEACL